MKDLPYEERRGGSYVRTSKDEKPRLVEATRSEPVPQPAPSAPTAANDQSPDGGAPAKKGK